MIHGTPKRRKKREALGPGPKPSWSVLRLVPAHTYLLMACFIVILFAISGLGIKYGVWGKYWEGRRAWAEYQARGIRVDAIVREAGATRGKGKALRYWFEYEFVDQKGNKHRARVDREQAVGQVIPVIYLPEDADASIEASASPPSFIGACFLTVIMLIVPAGASYLFVELALTEGRKILARKGTASVRSRPKKRRSASLLIRFIDSIVLLTALLSPIPLIIVAITTISINGSREQILKIMADGMKAEAVVILKRSAGDGLNAAVRFEFLDYKGHRRTAWGFSDAEQISNYPGFMADSMVRRLKVGDRFSILYSRSNPMLTMLPTLVLPEEPDPRVFWGAVALLAGAVLILIGWRVYCWRVLKAETSPGTPPSTSRA